MTKGSCLKYADHNMRAPRQEVSRPLTWSGRFSPLHSLILSAVCFSSQAASYSGNGDAGFGGAIGGSTLSLSDNGTTIIGTLKKGAGNFNDVLVLYIDSVSGGISETSGLADGADGLRKAISGFDGAANRSLLIFASGFLPDYAIALGPASDSYGGLWQLANGAANSLVFKTSVNLTPVGNPGTAPVYTFSFKFSDIGLAPSEKFMIVGTYVSNTGFRSGEAIAGNFRGSQGWTPFIQSSNAVYGVPEVTIARPATAGLSVPTPVYGTAEEKQLCWKNLQRIAVAIDAYRAKKKALPSWLSDLVPEFLDDANVLTCPVTKHTGQIQNFGLADPKLPTSYIYEFCNEPIPLTIGGGSQHTMREWKLRQMERVGDIVPLVRCHLHNPLLNLSYGGKVYESPAAWETMVTNQVSAAELTVAGAFAREAPGAASRAQEAAPSPLKAEK